MIAALQDESPLVRIKAARGLGQLGDQRAVQPLLSTLEVNEVPLQQAAFHALLAIIEPRDLASREHRAIELFVGLLRLQEVREAATKALIAMGAPVVEKLRELLTEPSPQVRQTVVEVLGQIGDNHAVEALVSSLRDENQAVRQIAAQYLGRLHWEPLDDTQRVLTALAQEDWQRLVQLQGTAVQPLIGVLHDQSPEIRQGAARTLGEIKTEDAIEALLGELQASSPPMRATVIEALVKIADTYTMARLVDKLSDDNPIVRQAAAEAFLQLKAKAVKPLSSALQSPSAEVRCTAAQLLGQIGNKRAIPVLAPALRDTEVTVALTAVEALTQIGKSGCEPLATALEDNRREVHLAAAKTLTALGWQPPGENERVRLAIILEDWDTAAKVGGAAVAPLINILGDSDPNRSSSASRVLSSIGTLAVEPLIAALEDDRWEVRQIVVRTLGSIHDPRAMLPLIKLIHDLSTSVREEVVLALGQFDDAQAVEALKEALRDRSLNVQVAAAGGLRKLKWRPANDDEFLPFAIASRDWRGLAQKGMPQAIDLMLQHLYEKPQEGDYWAKDIQASLLALVPVSALSEEVVTWIVDASGYEHKYQGREYDAGYISLDLSDQAVRRLCRLNLPVTSNALHLIAKKKDIVIHMDSGCGNWDSEVSFQLQRQRALQELQRRGNPPYQPQAYLEVQGRDIEAERAQIMAAISEEKGVRYREIMDALRKNGDLSFDLYMELGREFKTQEVQNLLTQRLAKMGGGFYPCERRELEHLISDISRYLHKQG